jgi:biopolymer transport protein ExbD
MGMLVGGSKRGIMTEMNVVPLIDVLLVLLVIFMIIPNSRASGQKFPRRVRIRGPKRLLMLWSFRFWRMAL